MNASGVELVWDARAELGECPCWDAASGRVAWIDGPARAIHWFAPGSGRTETAGVPLQLGSIAPRRSGGLVMALEDGFWLLEPDHATVQRLTPLPDWQTGTRMNDGKCHPDGSFWAGTVLADLSPAGILWRLSPDGSLRPILRGIRLSNGLGWSPDGLAFYFVDSRLQRLDAFDYDSDAASLSRRRTVASFESGSVLPDGMTVDAEGYIWVALWGGWAVHRYAPDGRLDGMISLPVSNVTSCTFGGADLADLFITSAREGLSPAELAEQPLAGGLFMCRGAGRGLTTATFEA